MDEKDKSLKKKNTVVGELTPTCYKGNEAWQVIFGQNVCNSCKTTEDALHYQTEQRVSVRLDVVACLLEIMEQTKHIVPPSLQGWLKLFDPDRCFRFMGLWGSVQYTVVTMAMAPSVKDKGIMAKELVPIIVSCIAWGPQLSKLSL